MKQNRKRSQRMSVMAVRSTYFAIGLVTALAVGLINLCASTTCKQMEKEIGLKERELASLENSRKRAASSWEQMKTKVNLDRALAKHGLSMKVAQPYQVVRMRSDARPYPGQLSVSWAKSRFTGISAAANEPVAAAPAKPRTAKRKQRR